jgi:hypothetical protein
MFQDCTEPNHVLTIAVHDYLATGQRWHVGALGIAPTEKEFHL